MNNTDLEQDVHLFAQSIKNDDAKIIAIMCSHQNNYILVYYVDLKTATIYKHASMGFTELEINNHYSVIHIDKPQTWFINFLYKIFPKGKKYIEFYIKESYNIRERFNHDNLDEELKTFVMTITLAGNL